MKKAQNIKIEPNRKNIAERPENEYDVNFR